MKLTDAERPHSLADNSRNQVMLLPLSVRLYNSLSELRCFLRDNVLIVGDRQVQTMYMTAYRVLNEARRIAEEGTIEFTYDGSDNESGRVARGLRATGPNSVPLDSSKPRSR